MIKLLLVTWNVEGHEILDIEEAEPQLAFIAYWMTKKGQQTISADELNNCLIEARKQMPEILGYTNINPSEFIKRVESRSSLLIMSGHKRLDSGHISAIYEFLHLSFQEYLAAKAIVKKFIPRSDIANNVTDIIKPNIDNENWKEVIPLAAVLLERETKELIEYLITESKNSAHRELKEGKRDIRLAPLLLGNCLANEIQINPDLLGTAIEWYSKSSYSVTDKSINEIILKNKFGNVFRKKVKECFFERFDDKFSSELGSTLADIFLADTKNPENLQSIPNEVILGLQSDLKEDKCMAILGMMNFAYGAAFKYEVMPSLEPEIEKMFNLMYDLLESNDPHYLFSICWCVAWSGESNIFPDSQRNKYVVFLAKTWTKPNKKNIRRVISWALCKITIPSIKKQSLSKIRNLKTTIRERIQKPENEFDKITSVFLGAILGETFEKNILKEIFSERIKLSSDRPEKSSSISLFAEKLKIQDLGKKI
jgi:hypothetical protein